jgi:uncharacterized membrane protein
VLHDQSVQAWLFYPYQFLTNTYTMESQVLIITTEENVASSLPPATGSANINVGVGERIGSVFLGAATTAYGLRHLGSLGGLALTLTGGVLLYRGLTGYCPVNNAIGRNSVNRRTSAMEANETFSINKPRSEVYAFWRQLENLPKFMKHLKDVKVEDSLRSTWTAEVPGGLGTISWEAVITDDRDGELLSWASLPGSTVDNAGEVRFKDDTAGGTEIQVSMSYRLPAGDLGTVAGKLFSPFIESMIKEDILRLKSIMETGEVASEISRTGAESSSTSETKAKKGRQSRKKPDPSPDYNADRSSEFNESDLLERT